MKKSLLYSLLLMVCVACGGGDDGGGETPQINKDKLEVPKSLELLGDGQAADITIDATCSWTISKDADWLTVTPMSGSNNKTTVTIAAMKNSTGADRMAILTVQGGTAPTKKVEVTQKPSSDTPTQKSLSVNTTSLEFEKDGGNQSFTITSNTSWTISCPEWCVLTETSGSGNATITVTVEKNEKTEKREGQIVINGEDVDTVYINVSQKASTGSNPNSGDNLPPS